MSARTMCPNPDAGCAWCIEAFEDEHPEVERVVAGIFDVTGCPMWGVTEGDELSVGRATRERNDRCEVQQERRRSA